jgi:hypothetical protein
MPPKGPQQYCECGHSRLKHGWQWYDKLFSACGVKDCGCKSYTYKEIRKTKRQQRTDDYLERLGR